MRLLFTIFLVWFYLTNVQVNGQTTNMSRFRSLIEEKTCHQLIRDSGWNLFGSIYLWDHQFRWYTDEKLAQQSPYEARIDEDQESLQINITYVRIPIYNVDIDQNYVKHRYFSPNEEPQLIKDFQIRYEVEYFYPLDQAKLLYIFSFNTMTDLYLIYNYRTWSPYHTKQPDVISMQHFPKATIPLFHWKANNGTEVYDVDSKVPTTFINNVHFTYQSGHLGLRPLTIEIDQTYYYGFNRNLTKIYFAKQFHYLKQFLAADYLPAEWVVSVTRWHPFLCYDYVYLYLADWILIFPHLNLTELSQKLNNPAIIQASITMMHVNTFVRCSQSSSKTTNVPTPQYPSLDVTVVLATLPTNHRLILICTALALVTILSAMFILIRKLKKPKIIPEPTITECDDCEAPQLIDIAKEIVPEILTKKKVNFPMELLKATTQPKAK